MNDRAVSVFENYDVKILGTAKGRGALLAETEQGWLILKEYTGPEARLELQEKLLQAVRDAGIPGVEQLLRNKDGELCSRDQDRTAYIVKTWFEGRECNLRDVKECQNAARTLGRLHLAMEQPQLAAQYTGRPFSLEREYARHNRELKKVRRYLREKELSTVESLDAYLDTVSGQAVSIRAEMKPKEKRMKEIDTLLSHIANFEAHKPVHAEYAAIRFKKPKEQFAAAHRDELDAYNAAVRYFKVHLEGTKYSTKKLNEERTQLAGEVAEYKERLSAVQEDVKILRDVRHWLNQVLPSEQYRQTAEPGKKPSIQQAVKGRAQRIREEQAEKRQQPRTEKKQDMEL